jgi:hypothetical protein
MLMVCGGPIDTQLIPSADVNALITLPLRDSFSQYGSWPAGALDWLVLPPVVLR